MLRYIIQRILYMIPTLFGMSLVSFLIIQLPPGDYLSSLVATMSDNGQTVDPAQIARPEADLRPGRSLLCSILEMDLGHPVTR